MNILFYQWNAYNGPDTEGMLKLLGHRVTGFAERFSDANRDPVFAEKFRKALCSGHYDIVFSIDYFSVISEVCEGLGIPYVSWSCDAALTSMYHSSVFNKCNYIFLFDRADYLEFKNKGLSHVYHLPLAAAAERIDAALEQKSPPEEAPEISFVGTLYAKNQYDALSESFSPYLKGYLDACIEAQLNISGGNLLELMMTEEILELILKDYRIEKQPGSGSDPALFFVRNVLGYKAAREERLRVLKALGERFPVTLYGPEAPPDHVMEKAGKLSLRPALDYWEELPGVYAVSRINLNLTIPNIGSGVPLRVFDILASGGFLMTNDRPELHTLFTPGKDLVIFDGIPDLISQAKFYLEHEQERLAIAHHGRETVRKHHSLRLRLMELMSVLETESLEAEWRQQ